MSKDGVLTVIWPDWWFGEDQILVAGKLNLNPGISLISGPSGFGKTTLLRNISSNNPALCSILVFQEPTLLPWLTLDQNLLLVTKSISDSEYWLDVFGLTDCRTLRPGQMSLGMQRRAAIVRGLLKNPTLLMLDEPTASLDQNNIDKLVLCLTELQELKDISIIVVSHQQEHFRTLNPDSFELNGRPAELKRIN